MQIQIVCYQGSLGHNGRLWKSKKLHPRLLKNNRYHKAIPGQRITGITPDEQAWLAYFSCLFMWFRLPVSNESRSNQWLLLRQPLTLGLSWGHRQQSLHHTHW